MPDSVLARLEASFVVRPDPRGVAGVVTIPADVVDEAFLDMCGPELRVVANFGVGYDSVHIAAATERGIVVTNTPDVLTGATAELTFALLLALVRRVAEGDRLIRRRGDWGLAPTFMLGHGLEGKTLGVIGLGRIGREVARLGEAFGMRVVHTRGSGPYEDLPMAELLAQADVVTLHVPLTAETRHLIGRDELERMRPAAVLVNVARGPIVDEEALVRALEVGAIAGAALDVFEDEPHVHPGLLARENVVLTPHLGSATLEAREAMGVLCAEALEAVLLQHRLPPTAVNPEALNVE
ncbi:MAG TPA: D-glycerate dehydrogenase [Gaiellaceae bacterium]|nr:D-glycerate dehydrogenase [Gaiellaceae bacterium]